MDSSTHRNRKRKPLQVHPSGESLEGRQLLSVAGSEVDAAVPAEVMTTTILPAEAPPEAVTTQAEPDVMLMSMTGAPRQGRGLRAGRQARAVQVRLARQRPARIRLARLAALAASSSGQASPAIGSASPTAVTLGAPTAALNSARSFRPETGANAPTPAPATRPIAPTGALPDRAAPAGLSTVGLVAGTRGARYLVLGGGDAGLAPLRRGSAPIGTMPAAPPTVAPPEPAPAAVPASALGGGHTASGRWMMPPGGVLDEASLAIDSAPAVPRLDPASAVTGDAGMARRKIAPMALAASSDATMLPGLGAEGTMSSIRFAPGGADVMIDSGPTQAQLAAFDKLWADTQAIHDKSEVTPAMLAAHRKDLEAIDKAATGPADPAKVAILRSVVKAPAAALPTADQKAQIAAAFVDAVRSRGVADDALIAKAIVDAGTIADATQIDAADLALLAADRQAAGIPADSSWADWDLDLGLSLGTNIAFGYDFVDMVKPFDQGETTVVSSEPVTLIAPATTEVALAVTSETLKVV